MLTEGKRFAINILQRDECGDRTLSLGQKDGLVGEVRDIVGERSNSRGQLQSLHSRIFVSPIVGILRGRATEAPLEASVSSFGRSGTWRRRTDSGPGTSS